MNGRYVVITHSYANSSCEARSDVLMMLPY